MNWSGRRVSSGPRRLRSCSCCRANKSGCSNAATSPRCAARSASRSLAAACAACSLRAMSDSTALRPARASATAVPIRDGGLSDGAVSSSSSCSISPRARSAIAAPRFSISSETTRSSSGSGICVCSTMSCMSLSSTSPFSSSACTIRSRACDARWSGSRPAIPSGAGKARCSSASGSICGAPRLAAPATPPTVPPSRPAATPASAYSLMASSSARGSPACIRSRTCCPISVGTSTAAPAPAPVAARVSRPPPISAAGLAINLAPRAVMMASRAD